MNWFFVLGAASKTIALMLVAGGIVGIWRPISKAFLAVLPALCWCLVGTSIVLPSMRTRRCARCGPRACSNSRNSSTGSPARTPGSPGDGLRGCAAAFLVASRPIKSNSGHAGGDDGAREADSDVASVPSNPPLNGHALSVDGEPPSALMAHTKALCLGLLGVLGQEPLPSLEL
jgi:hypothetical protein